MAICQTNEHIVGHFIHLNLSTTFVRVCSPARLLACTSQPTRIPYHFQAIRRDFHASCYFDSSLHLFIYGCHLIVLHFIAECWNIATAELDIFAFYLHIIMHWFFDFPFARHRFHHTNYLHSSCYVLSFLFFFFLHHHHRFQCVCVYVQCVRAGLVACACASVAVCNWSFTR